MEWIVELFSEIIIRRIIAGFFGYYTLLFIYKILGNKKGIEWLTSASKHEGEEFGKGCMIGIVGAISFTLLFMIFIYIGDLIIQLLG